ncbi:hypothetical protein LJC36_00255 [Desulfovibrio sp. OttesenSCG-928-C14]|nr:hypothetical protein [Desulfovibrio sp. OttesenSCG-928-C14]
MLIQPKEVQIKCLDGSEKTFVVSKFPAVAGREIVTQYPLTALPKIGEYKSNEALMLKLMGYVAVPNQNNPDAPIILSTRALVDNHVPDWEALARLELAVMDYNCSFFKNGRASTFFAGLGNKAASKITGILTGLLASLSAPAKQR